MKISTREHMKRGQTSLLFLCLVVAAASCSDNGACQVGDTRPCTCPDGRQLEEICVANGEAWDGCNSCSQCYREGTDCSYGDQAGVCVGLAGGYKCYSLCDPSEPKCTSYEGCYMCYVDSSFPQETTKFCCALSGQKVVGDECQAYADCVPGVQCLLYGGQMMCFQICTDTCTKGVCTDTELGFSVCVDES